jgi:hypothetical protein
MNQGSIVNPSCVYEPKPWVVSQVERNSFFGKHTKQIISRERPMVGFISSESSSKSQGLTWPTYRVT